MEGVIYLQGKRTNSTSPKSTYIVKYGAFTFCDRLPLMETITIDTVGISRGNPGPSAIGVYLYDTNDQMICEVAEAIGNATETFAAYQAVLRGLQVAKEQFEEKTAELQFELKLDSTVVMKQLTSQLEVNEPGLVPYFIAIHNLRISSFPNLTISVLSRESNQNATALVNEVLSV